MNLIVALKREFQRELCDLWTFHEPNFKNHLVYMNTLTKCERKKIHGTVPVCVLFLYELIFILMFGYGFVRLSMIKYNKVR